MKNTIKVLLTITILMLSLAGCSIKLGEDKLQSQLVGIWYRDGDQEPAFVLYDDGTCEIAGEYGEGTWNVVNDNYLKLTNFYGITETAPIISIENNCLTLGTEDSQVQFWNSPQTSNDELQDIDEKVKDRGVKENNLENQYPIEEDNNIASQETTDNMVRDNLVSLETLEVVESDRIKIDEEGAMDHEGIIHDNAVSFDTSWDGYAEYRLDGKYSQLTGTMFVSPAASKGKDITVSIYLDGKLVECYENITEEMSVIPLKLDLKGVNRLRIETTNQGTYDHGWLRIVDTKVE